MTNHSCGRSRPNNSRAFRPPNRTAFREPPVRVWPHNTNAVSYSPEQEAGLHFLRCSLSYQNQTLAEIKTLLERLAIDADAEQNTRKNSG